MTVIPSRDQVLPAAFEPPAEEVAATLLEAPLAAELVEVGSMGLVTSVGKVVEAMGRLQHRKSQLDTSTSLRSKTVVQVKSDPHFVPIARPTAPEAKVLLLPSEAIW